uniref:ALG1 chitobiosyldiphosphodolichol beta-mannosyltransferase n=1 Tax=Erpetoichthys calabaricus TaxID=27687 RepID=A0A8C4T0W5_ERPCA
MAEHRLVLISVVLPLAAACAYGLAVTRGKLAWVAVFMFAVLCLLRVWSRCSRAGVPSVCVLVLGDIGRSPRMQYHCLSLSRHGYGVTLLGYRVTKPHPDLLNEKNIQICPISEVKGLTVGPAVLRYIVKVVLQCLQLFYALLRIDAPHFILLQNPPGLPSIAVAWFICLLRASKLMIDWHNYGYTIMALSLGERNPIVRLAKWYEKLFGRLSDYNLCVTNAMKEDLSTNWNIKAVTLYDRPPSRFKESALEDQHHLYLKLSKDYPSFRSRETTVDDTGDQTAFTERDQVSGLVAPIPVRPALLISSTSWTEDEDFSVLLEALEEYEDFIKEGAKLPDLVCVITGTVWLK